MIVVSNIPNVKILAGVDSLLFASNINFLIVLSSLPDIQRPSVINTT